MPQTEQCLLGAKNEGRIRRNEKDIKTLWEAVDEIKKLMVYRLPLWAVALISALTGLVGWLLNK